MDNLCPKCLMIGDIVLATYVDDDGKEHDIVVRVDAVDENGTLVDGYKYISCSAVRGDDYEQFDTIKGYQIKETLLKSLGLYKVDDDGSRYRLFVYGKYCIDAVLFDNMCLVNIDNSVDDMTNKVHLSVRYLHEFQHALRLCGLNELADSII